MLSKYAHIPWKFCVFHKNHHLLQTGDKESEVTMDMYDLCREHGAVIATGHEHSYERTHLMSSFSNLSVQSTSSSLHIKPGSSFAFVSGLGGDSIRAWHNNSHLNPWWAATAALDNGVNFGALMCELEEQRGRCEFNDIDGNRWDAFEMTVGGEDTVTRQVTLELDYLRGNHTRLEILVEEGGPLTLELHVKCHRDQLLIMQGDRDSFRKCTQSWTISDTELINKTWTSPDLTHLLIDQSLLKISIALPESQPIPKISLISF